MGAGILGHLLRNGPGRGRILRALMAGAAGMAGVAGIAGGALAQQAAGAALPRWTGWAEIGGYLGGSGSDRGEVAVFAPLTQTADGLLFTDLRGKLFSEQISEINAALGYRRMLPSGWNLGVWAGGDRRRSAHDNTFWAVSGGFEALSDRLDLRLNGYWAVSDAKGSPFTASARIEGAQVLMQGAREVPLSGFDGEVGVRLPLGWLGADPARHALRAYAGGFHFDADAAPESVSGPKARLEMRLDDFVPVMPGSRLSLESEWRSDKVRGGNVELGVRLRLPFNVVSGGAEVGRVQPAQWRRMVDGLERDTDIVTRPSGSERVEDVATGIAIDRVVHADAATGLTALATASGGNTLIVVDGAAGTLSGQQSLQPGQTVLGGGGSIRVRGRTSGIEVMLTAPGARPTLHNPADTPTLVLADRTHAAGLDVRGELANLSNDGVSIGSSMLAVLEDVDIRRVGGAGINAQDGNTLTLRNVTVADTIFGPGLAINNSNRVVIEGGRLDMTLFGVFANDANHITVNGTAFANTCADGVRIDDDNVLAITGASFTAMCAGGITFDSRNTITIADTRFDGIANEVLLGADDNTLTLTGLSVSQVVEDFIDVADNNTIALSNSTVTGLGERGVYLGDGNRLTITGGTLSAAWEGLDANDGNTITLTNTAIASTGGQEGVDISDNNVLTVTGTTISAQGNNVLEMTVGNQVSLNGATLAGAPTNVIRFDGAGNAVSGSGNVNAATPSGALCSDIGGQVGSIAFADGSSCP